MIMLTSLFIIVIKSTSRNIRVWQRIQQDRIPSDEENEEDTDIEEGIELHNIADIRRR